MHVRISLWHTAEWGVFHESNREVNNPQPRWDFFLAHASPDALLADELYELLCPVARTFLDSRSLLLGDDWDRKLLNAQRDSRITVVLVSKNTDGAYYQREEIANAIEMARKQETEHRVVPVYVDTSAKEIDTPYGLKLKRGVKLSEAGGIDGLAGKLLELLANVESQESCNSDLGLLTEKELILQRRVSRPTSRAAPSQLGEAPLAMGGGGFAIPLPPPLGPP